MLILLFLPQTLSVKGVQERMSCPVGNTTATMGLASLAVLVGLTSKGALVNLALRGS